MKKYLIIPIEIQKRELSAACNLIVEALKKNWTVIIGQKQQIFPFIINLPKSIWFLKSIVPGENSLLKKIKKSGHLITSLDIEGLIPSNIKESLRQRYSVDNINLSDAIFFWGKIHYNLFLKTFPKTKKNILFITGSPVNDVWIKNKSITNHNKKNILIIPSFGYANTYTKNLNLFYAYDNVGAKSLSNHNDLLFSIKDNIENDFQSQKLGYKSFINLITILCKHFTDHIITIRPHPSENIAMWNFLLKDNTNLRIDSKEDSQKQILKSKAVIHFNSTMSVQSSLLNKKTILYFDIDKKYKKILSPLTLKLSKFVTKPSEVIKEINNNERDDKLNFLKKLLVNVEFNWSSNSSKSIVSIFDSLLSNFKNNYLYNEKIFFNGLYSKYLFGRYYFLNYYLVPFLSYFSFIPFLRRFSHGNIYRKYKIDRDKLLKNKWPGISIYELSKVIQEAALGRKFNSKWKIKRHFAGFFFVSKK